MATDLGLVDTRAINKPQALRKGAVWSDWKFQFENYCACVDPMINAKMTSAASLVEPAFIAAEDVNQVRRGTTLYAILASLLEGRELQLCKVQRATRNGYIVWQNVVAEREPKHDNRALALSWTIMEAKELEAATMEDFMEKLLRWGERGEEYRQSCGMEVQNDVKRAIVMMRAPLELRTHLNINAGQLKEY